MRINHVAAARKDQGDCGVCGLPITKGQAYKFIEPRYGGKQKRHEECRTWRQSEMTSSKLATVYAAQESYEDGGPYSTKEDLETALSSVAEDIRSVAEEYRESASNIEQYFSSSEKADELNDWADQLDQWADEVESAVDDVEETCTECQQSEDDGPHHEFEAPPDAGKDDDVAPCAECGEEEEQHHEYDPELDTGAADDKVQECPI